MIRTFLDVKIIICHTKKLSTFLRSWMREPNPDRTDDLVEVPRLESHALPLRHRSKIDVVVTATPEHIVTKRSPKLI